MRSFKFWTIFLLITLFASLSFADQHKVFPFYDGTTGGTTGKLDNIDACNANGVGYDLQDQDLAIGGDSANSRFLFYWFDIDSAASESDPDVIKPDKCDGVAYTGNGRWIKIDPDDMLNADVVETLTAAWDLASSDCDSCTGIPLDSDFGSNGIMVRTGAGTYGIGTTFDIPMGGEDYILMGEAGDPYNAEQVAPAAALTALTTARGDVARTDYFSTSTKTGWAATPTGNIFYKVVDDMVFVNFSINGTSNSTTTSFTVPETSMASLGVNFYMARMRDGDAFFDNGFCNLPASSTTVTCYTDNSKSAADWTATLTKQITGQFWYYK